MNRHRTRNKPGADPSYMYGPHDQGLVLTIFAATLCRTLATISRSTTRNFFRAQLSPQIIPVLLDSMHQLGQIRLDSWLIWEVPVGILLAGSRASYVWCWVTMLSCFPHVWGGNGPVGVDGFSVFRCIITSCRYIGPCCCFHFFPLASRYPGSTKAGRSRFQVGSC